MNDERKGFLEYLQALPEPSKKRVLVIASAVAMVVVIYFWLAYFNSMIASISQTSAPVVENTPAATAQAPATANGSTPQSAAPGEGVGQQLQGDLGFVYGGFVNLVHGIGNIFNAPGRYNIQPSQ